MRWGKQNLAHLSRNHLYFIGNGLNEEKEKAKATHYKKEPKISQKKDQPRIIIPILHLTLPYFLRVTIQFQVEERLVCMRPVLLVEK